MQQRYITRTELMAKPSGPSRQTRKSRGQITTWTAHSRVPHKSMDHSPEPLPPPHVCPPWPNERRVEAFMPGPSSWLQTTLNEMTNDQSIQVTQTAAEGEPSHGEDTQRSPEPNQLTQPQMEVQIQVCENCARAQPEDLVRRRCSFPECPNQHLCRRQACRFEHRWHHHRSWAFWKVTMECTNLSTEIMCDYCVTTSTPNQAIGHCKLCTTPYCFGHGGCHACGNFTCTPCLNVGRHARPRCSGECSMQRPSEPLPTTSQEDKQ